MIRKIWGIAAKFSEFNINLKDLGIFLVNPQLNIRAQRNYGYRQE
ncbi:hypothetical protein ACTJKN_10460 [Pedobacter sp. 22163]